MALGELAQLTEGLDPDCLTVGVLIYVDRYTQEEVAASLEVSRRTVGKRLSKFRKHVEKRRMHFEKNGGIALQKGVEHVK